MKIRSILSTFVVCTSLVITHAQETKKVKLSAYDGVLVGGYVDEGAFLNFTGPNINLVFKQSKLSLGMLPSLRFKEDHGTPKNAFVTPNLGAGLTYTYKWFAIQIPCYYNAKTATKNGHWYLGIGVGVRLNGFKK
ncbi:MAG: hypothetical protein V4604_04795 [Bacteroidota bacterium]